MKEEKRESEMGKEKRRGSRSDQEVIKMMIINAPRFRYPREM